MRIRSAIIFFLTIVIFQSCSENKYQVDVSDIDVEISISRLDKDLFKVTVDNASEQIPQLQRDYGEFFNVYNRKILQIGGTEQTDYSLKLEDFQKYCSDAGIQDSVWKKYPDLNRLETDLKDAFRHYKYYFPEKEVPEVMTCISAFNESVVTVGNTIGVALDKYLGGNSSFYERLVTERYLRRRMIPEAVVPDVMRARAMADFPYQSTSDDMLDNMIYEGKIQYYLNCMLPEVSDTIKWRYTERQLGWAYQHEAKTWNYMVENKKVFSSDRLEIRQYVGDGPFTTPFTDVSAPRIGVFIGFRIVECYADNHPELTLAQLMAETDSKKILSESKYSPK